MVIIISIPCAAKTSKVAAKASNQKVIGAEQAGLKKQLKLYPNPLSRSSQLTISVPEEYSRGQLRVYNFSGGIVDIQIFQGGDHEYNLQKLPTGNYILQFESQNGSMKQTEKLIIK